MVQLSFASLNLENLHLPGEPIYGRPGLTPGQFDAKVSWTARVVRELDADVIGFQELWHPDALAAVFQHTGLDAYHVWTPPSAGRIGNAIAVRTPHQLESIEWIERSPDRVLLRAGSEDATGTTPALSAAGTDDTLSVSARDFSRPLLHATIKTHQGRRRPRVDIYVAHLKPKRRHGYDRATCQACRAATVRPWDPPCPTFGAPQKPLRYAWCSTMSWTATHRSPGLNEL